MGKVALGTVGIALKYLKCGGNVAANVKDPCGDNEERETIIEQGLARWHQADRLQARLAPVSCLGVKSL